MARPELTVSLTAKGWIVAKLHGALKPLAIHELGIEGYSENALATRMSELAADGVVVGRERRGGGVKEWRLTTAEEREAILQDPLFCRRKRAKVIAGRILGAPTTVAGQTMVIVAVSVDEWPGGAVRIEIPEEDND